MADDWNDLTLKKPTKTPPVDIRDGGSFTAGGDGIVGDPSLSITKRTTPPSDIRDGGSFIANQDSIAPLPPATTSTSTAGDGSVPASVPEAPAPSPTPASGGATPTDLAAILGGGGGINPMQQAAQEALLRLLTNSERAASISDPDLQPVADAYRSRRQRGYESERQALAERAAATGTLQGGGFGAEAVGALQGANRDTAMFEANLVKDRMDQKRSELQNAIQMAMQAGDTQAARALQRELAMVDATLRQQDLELRRSLGQDDLALRRLLGIGGLDLNRELGRADIDVRRQTLGQQGELGRGDLGLRLLQSLLQNDQFNSQLGLNAAQMQALLNQSAVQALLGG